MIVFQWFVWFIIYSLIGWLYETVLFSVRERKFVNRGFLNGPLLPIYGFGALAVLFALYGRTDNIITIFFASMLLTTALEYLTSVLLEKLFHAKWWDYSHRRFNLHGRVSLTAAVIFGVMSVLQIRFLHPLISRLTGGLPDTLLIGLSAIVFAALAADIVITIRHLLTLNGRLNEIQSAINGFLEQTAQRAEELKNALLDSFEESEYYNERIQTLCCQDQRRNERIVKAFPKLRSVKYEEAFCKLKEKLDFMRENG